MKWGNHSEKAVERVEQFAARLFSAKGLYLLLVLATFLLLSSAGDKWGQ
jgi:hypothetical protein